MQLAYSFSFALVQTPVVPAYGMQAACYFLPIGFLQMCRMLFLISFTYQDGHGLKGLQSLAAGTPLGPKAPGSDAAFATFVFNRVNVLNLWLLGLRVERPRRTICCECVCESNARGVQLVAGASVVSAKW